MRWLILLLLATLTSAVVNNGGMDGNNDGPPGLIEIQKAEDLIAEASETSIYFDYKQTIINLTVP